MTTFGDVRAAVAARQHIGKALTFYDDKTPVDQVLRYALDHIEPAELARQLLTLCHWEAEGRMGTDGMTVIDRWEGSSLTVKTTCFEYTWPQAQLPVQRAALRLRREAFEEVWMPSMGQSAEPAFVQMTRALSEVLATLEAYIQGWVSYDEVEHVLVDAWPLQSRCSWMHPWSDAELACHAILRSNVKDVIDDLSHIPTAREADGVTFREHPHHKREAAIDAMHARINRAMLTEALTAIEEGLR
jgi:hypothetical protein